MQDIRLGIRKTYQLFYPYLYGKIISKLVYYSKYEITGIYEYLSTTISKVVANSNMTSLIRYTC